MANIIYHIFWGKGNFGGQGNVGQRREGINIKLIRKMETFTRNSNSNADWNGIASKL